MTKRSEGPWVVAEDVFNDRPEIRDRDGRLIAVVMALYPMSAKTQSANASFIITACNCHDELVAALEITRGQWIHSVNADQCLAALAKAEGVKE